VGADVAPLVADGATLIHDTADGAAQRRAEDVAELWNAITKPPIPRCRDLTSKRRRHTRARLSERSLDEWRQVFEKIQASSFCRGESDRGWVASFDWAIGSPDVAVKVLEGKYDDRPKSAPRTPTTAATSRYRDWTPAACPHTPSCSHPTICLQRQDIAAQKTTAAS
jgi:hypothetical protein